MMKTLKYIVLLTVMLVNVTPYIKDGKLEWKANEAAAQNYVCESNFFQGLFGVYKCEHKVNKDDWFYGDNDKCVISPNQCVCSKCHHLFTCNGNSKCGCGLFSGFSTSIGNPNILIFSPSENWCAFAIMAFILTENGSPTDTGTSSTYNNNTSNQKMVECTPYAEHYFEKHRVPTITSLSEMYNYGMNPADLESHYSGHGISISAGVSNAEDLIDKMNGEGGDKGVLVSTPTNGGHLILGYKLRKGSNDSNGEAEVTFYDPYKEVNEADLNYTNDSFQNRMLRGEFLRNWIVK